VRYLDTRCAAHDEIKNFEYKLLGEVRMLGALRKHRSIVDVYGHQFSSKWVQDDGGKEYRILQSVILMEYVNGGSLKVKCLSVFFCDIGLFFQYYCCDAPFFIETVIFSLGLFDKVTKRGQEACTH
jgi:serine/threonine protein kinase